MTTKRSIDATSPSDSVPSAKRRRAQVLMSRNGGESSSDKEPSDGDRNNYIGQRTQRVALPSLADDEVFDDAASDADDITAYTREALTYLKSVRSQANSIPDVLVAPRQNGSAMNSATSGVDLDRADPHGVYSDGVYFAAPVLGPDFPAASSVVMDSADSENGPGVRMSAKEAYTVRLLANFDAQCAAIRAVPHSAIKKLPQADVLSTSARSRNAIASIRSFIKSHRASNTIAAAISQDDALRIIRVILDLTIPSSNISPHYSTWLWGMLCRLEGAAALDYNAVGVVRDLGKHMAHLASCFVNGQVHTTDRIQEQWHHQLHEPQSSDAGANGRIDPQGALDGSSEGEVVLPLSSTQLVESSEGVDLPLASRQNGGSVEQNVSDVRKQPILPDAEEQTSVTHIANRRNTSSPIPEAEDTPMATMSSASLAQSPDPRIEASRRRILDRLRDLSSQPEPLVDEPDFNTRATIDAIITIVAERYGQRDLLEFRNVWEEDMGLWR